ncbi:DUF5994 family protein [Streptomyces iconiensis]|uniref:DUF5994 family protein n=1 Tax=Streptomyces iconiensis TaxID=1384038 RepID=A0ABT6ZR40_9ACTN|nr:DUF5994 family protein [Streptomyces iconiensis]MDJ1131527.1 DUF5994 family protein [Streptomyces iconiensis]
MTTVTTDRTLKIHEPFRPPPVRLSLRPEGSVAGLLDGAWWPYSRDLLRELPALTALLEPLWGRTTRITVDPALWPVVPRKVPVAGHAVSVAWFRAEQDPHKLVLLSFPVGRHNLLVVPPEASAAKAARLMAAASDPDLLSTAGTLVAMDAMAEARSGPRSEARSDPRSDASFDAKSAAEGEVCRTRERSGR